VGYTWGGQTGVRRYHWAMAVAGAGAGHWSWHLTPRRRLVDCSPRGGSLWWGRSSAAPHLCRGAPVPRHWSQPSGPRGGAGPPPPGHIFLRLFLLSIVRAPRLSCRCSLRGHTRPEPVGSATLGPVQPLGTGSPPTPAKLCACAVTAAQIILPPTLYSGNRSAASFQTISAAQISS
jgi:hypothetical protein